MKNKFTSKLRVALVSVILVSSAFNFSHRKSYQLFNSKGGKTSFKKMVNQAAKADVILFGELHNNPICHWLELELAKAVHEKSSRSMVLGAEMFETDNHEILQQFLANQIDEDSFENGCRLWPNYQTDYKPLVNFAFNNQIPFAATNIPRRYARIVYRGRMEALDTLPDDEKAWIAPLPIAYDSSLKCYSDIFKMAGGHGGQNLPMAQAVKDATMAYNIVKHRPDGGISIHYNGTYHSNNYQSIYWYLKKLDPSLNILTIASTEQKSIDKLSKEEKGVADFILAIQSDMTKTY